MANSVELFVLKPHCKAAKISFLFRKFLILLSIIFSKTLEKISKIEMGRKLPKCFGDQTFEIDIPYAIL